MVHVNGFQKFWCWCALGALVLHSAAFVSPAIPALPLIDSTVPASFPFQDGEQVRFEVSWRPLPISPSLKAGEIDFRIRKQEYLGTPAYRITAQARSGGVLAFMGWEIEDEFESIVDARDFRSLKFIHRKRHRRRSTEEKKKRDLELIVDYQAGQAQVREIDLANSQACTVRSQKIEDLPGAISDVLSVFYAGRLRELRPTQKYLIYLHDNGRIKHVKVEVEALETIRSGLDSHDCVRLRTEDGIFRGGGHFRIWYSRDALRLPVRFEASAKLGTVFGKLIFVQTPRFSKTRIRIS